MIQRVAGGSARFWLHAEGLAALIAGVALYGALGGAWLWLVPLLFVPDVSMIGYLGGKALGAHVYNLGHNWAVGLALLGLGFQLSLIPVSLAGAVVVAHVGMDRLLGYGLKYPTAFRDTHMQRA